MTYYGQKGTYQLSSQAMKSGGEGSIYTIIGQSQMVAKIYHQGSTELESKLTYMMNNPPSQNILSQIAWPVDVLRNQGGRFVGFVMPKLSIDCDLKEIYAYPPKKQITNDQKIVIALNICIVISAIHSAGYVFGDFNPMNIGINLTTGYVAFLDTDSYHIYDRYQGKTYRCNVCMDGYVAPELIQKVKGSDYAHAPLPTFTQETDRFSLAIHIFKLLMNGFTPFNGVKEGEHGSQASPGIGNVAIERDNYCYKPGNKPQSVAVPDISAFPSNMQALFQRAFVNSKNNPQARPTADEWLQALNSYRSSLKRCSANPNHYYHNQAVRCPYCEADYRYKQKLNSFRSGSTSSSQYSFTQPISTPNSSTNSSTSSSANTSSYTSSAYNSTTSSRTTATPNYNTAPATQQSTPSYTSTPTPSYTPAPQVKQKSGWLSLILCLFLGSLGIHNFYVGKNIKGIIYLCTNGLFFVGILFDLICILTGHFKDRNGVYVSEIRLSGKVKFIIVIVCILVGIFLFRSCLSI